MKKINTGLALSIAMALAATGGVALADNKGKNEGNQNAGNGPACSALAAALGSNLNGIQAKLKTALTSATTTEQSGLDLNMWATLVNRDGVVCAVAFSGANRGAQWPGSRVISAQKANTANAFSLDALALSTANLYAAVQPGGSLFGLQHSNPVDTGVAYRGPAKNFGQPNDPMVGERVGGVNVFGGGLALYDINHHVIGGVGLSGDTSCADHAIAWRVRNSLKLDNFGTTVKGVGPNASVPDGIVFDIAGGISAGGFGHPTCLNSGGPGPNSGNDPAASQAYANGLPAVQ